MDIKQVMQIINQYQQKGWLIEIEIHDQIEDGTGSIQDGQAVPHKEIKSNFPVRYTFTGYIWPDHRRQYGRPFLTPSFESLAELYSYLAEVMPRIPRITYLDLSKEKGKINKSK
ncbi:hypothetical protein [Lactobacillus crispatus]|uniref:hypothetical protein n=1 Tax=Lactobacillus crispatus TaxID=47770 RepID=UPI000E01C59E|nr:hypothetical protein [Lactobacillus crispatus]STX18479.1 Uncharacterised protein [Lactobacillus acidophilus]MCT7732125.1 hypothetical protein [Lactobacillus crispatus]MCT7870388.1 hypothetical protein [Lactobacillus crispatus]MCT7878805.1 hypothetical protein [Lactobacillus crispatus]MCT7889385.1 hypothetical protein [Lactobacillus crispatus]